MDSDNRKTKAQLISELDAARQQARELEKYSIVEKSNDGIVVLQDGLVVFANSKAAEITGFSTKDIMRKPFIDFVAPQFRELVTERYQKRLSGEKIPNKYEMGILNKAGSVISVEVNASLIEYDGKPATLSIVRDITEHKRTENLLRESEERYRTLFEASAEGIMIADIETKKQLYANAAICRMLGYSQEALTKLTVMDIHPRESLEHIIAEFTALAKGEKKLATVLCKRKDGTIFYADISAARAVIDGRDCNIGFFVDVTEREIARRTLEESEQKFRSLAEYSPNMVFINKAGRIVYANPQCETVMGYTVLEFYDTAFDFMSLIAPDDARTIQNNFKKHAAGKEVPPVEYTLVTKAGRRIECILSTKLIDYEGEKAIVGIITDITARKQAEKALTLQADLLNGVRDTVILHDLEGNIIYANNAACTVFGYTREELLKMNLRQISGSPETTRLIEPRIREVLEKGYTTFEVTNVRKDGSEISREIHDSLLVLGDRKMIVGVGHDITERNKIEEALKLQAGLLDLELDSVYVLDFDGNFLYVNKAACVIHGYTKEELLGMKLSELDDPESAKLIPSRFKEIMNKGAAMFELNHRHKNGSLIPLEVHVSVAELRGKKVIMNVARDISERRKVQQQMMTQDRLASIGQLVSGVAHELNNPLTSVIGFSELLLQKELPEDTRDDLKIISDEAKRTSTIVKNLLTFARQQPQEKQVLDVNQPIQAVLQLRSHEQSTNNLTVNVHFAPGLPLVIGNSSQLQQVFFNIVVNAEQAILEARKKGTLTVTTQRKGDFVRASFTDDGPGISRENMVRLFSPFFTTKPIGKGTGLGLSICQGIVSEHGGRIWAESEPGKGATFFIELPVYK